MKSIIIINPKFHTKGTYLRVADHPKVLLTFIAGNVYLVTDKVADVLIENDEARVYHGSYYGQDYITLGMVA